LQIPIDVYLVMARKGSVTPSDGRGTVTVMMADGSTHEERRVLIHELKVGDTIVTDVLATVSPIGSDPLLGQSFLARLGSYTIDNHRHVLTLG
jgi:predicted aspartyl protease